MCWFVSVLLALTLCDSESATDIRLNGMVHGTQNQHLQTQTPLGTLSFIPQSIARLASIYCFHVSSIRLPVFHITQLMLLVKVVMESQLLEYYYRYPITSKKAQK